MSRKQNGFDWEAPLPVPRPLARSDDTDTSQASARIIEQAKSTKTLMTRIHRNLRAVGPAASFEIAQRLQLSESSVWKRVSDLKTGGYIRDSGTRRYREDTNRYVTIWEAIE